MVLTPEIAEEIVLVARLGDMKLRDAAALILPKYGIKALEHDSWEITSELFYAANKLDKEFEAAHSTPTQQGVLP